MTLSVSAPQDAAPGYARLTTAPATREQRRAALVLSGILLLVLVVSLPFAFRPGPMITPLLPTFATLVCLADLATCYLLVVQFRVHRAPALMVLAAVYAFAGLMVIARTLTYPGIFSLTGLFEAHNDTAPWLWVFWYTGFPLGVLFALFVERYYSPVVTRRAAIILCIAFLGVVMALVFLLSLIALQAPGWLPTIVNGNDRHALFTSGVGVGVLVVNVGTLGALFRLGRGHGRGVVWMWVTVAVFASCCDVTITLYGDNRYDISWYSGRFDSLFTACLVLGALLTATNSLYYRLAVQEHELRTLFNLSPIGMARIALDDHFLETNAALCAMLGYTDTELRTRTLYGLVAPDDPLRGPHDHLRAIAGLRESQFIEAPFTRRDGSVFWAEVRLAVVRGHSGITPYCIVLVEDISARVEREQEIVYAAAHDALTGLPNRRQVMEHLAYAMRRSALIERKVAVLFVDLDGFKTINDSYGHEAGDAILREVARRLEVSIRTGDIAGRLGGDEFVLVLSGMTRRDDTEFMVARVRDALAMPFFWKGTVVAVGASVGVSLYPDDGEDVAALLGKADGAMYERKTARRAVGSR